MWHWDLHNARTKAESLCEIGVVWFHTVKQSQGSLVTRLQVMMPQEEFLWQSLRSPWRNSKLPEHRARCIRALQKPQSDTEGRPLSPALHFCIQPPPETNTASLPSCSPTAGSLPSCSPSLPSCSPTAPGLGTGCISKHKAWSCYPHTEQRLL